MRVYNKLFKKVKMTSSEILNKYIKVWNTNGVITHHEIMSENPLNVIIEFGIHKFIVICPKENDTTSSYIIKSGHKYFEYEWLDDLTLYCLEKNPTPKKFINILEKFVGKLQNDKYIEILNKQKNIYSSVENDVAKYVKQKELESLLDKSFGVVVSDKKYIYNKPTVGKIVIAEYMKLWNKLKYFTLELPDNNIYKWEIRFNSFDNPTLMESLAILKSKYGYSYISIEIYFHDCLYPNYPPVIKLVRPRLCNALMHKLSNMKMLQLKYWNPSCDIETIINKIYGILNSNAIIDTDTEFNDIEKYPNGTMLPIESYLLDLASFTEITLPGVDVEIDINTEKHTKPQNDTTNKTQTQTVWKSGTGYGSNNVISKWDVDKYLENVETRDKQAQILLNKITYEIQELTNYDLTVSIINDSVLPKYIISLLHETPLLEMRKHLPLYINIFNLLGNLVFDEAMIIYSTQISGYTIFDMLEKLYNMCLIAKQHFNIVAKYDVDDSIENICDIVNDINNTDNIDDDLVCIIINLFTMIEPCYKNYLRKINATKEQETGMNQDRQNASDNNTDKKKYVELMEKLRDNDDDVKLIGTNFYYQQNFNKEKTFKMSRDTLKRINDELLTLPSLPISYEALIISRYDSNYPTAIRTIITGPEDTPYEGGCFIFDTFLHKDFPANPPYVWFLNTGNKRMNPNLYNCGKVCLSILGTWHAQKGETWDPNISTLTQIYTSIQSQILVEEPYFNEPGFEKYNNETGKQNSKNYNDNVRLLTMKHAMYDLINCPDSYPQFSDVITMHFMLKKERILQVCKKWVNESPKTMKNEYEAVYDKLAEKLQKL